MMVALSDSADENMCVSDVARQYELAPSSKFSSVPSAESSAEPVLVEVGYVLSKDLKDLNNIGPQLETLLERLDSKEWLDVLEALNNVRQLAIFHTELLEPILGKVVTLVIKSLKNPRSALCKTAIMVSADILRGYHDQLIDILDPLLLQLLLRASQDKRFVCEEAERALRVMTMWIAPQPLLEKLQPYVRHCNPRVRAKASVCVYNSVSRLGIEGIMQNELESLIQVAAAQLNDRLPEAREAARKLLLHLHVVYCSSSPDISLPNSPVEITESKQYRWEQYCLDIFPAATALAVLRVTCVDS